jgi:NAD(P)-dependent dehydrogenase (short-subunit alcohol dehydrogenase family)
MAMVESSNKSSNLKFSDKIVVITGSGTGIGQAVAKKFAEEGASIIIMGRRKEPLDITSGILMDIIKKVGSSGTVRAFSGVDVSDEVGINEMFTTIKQEFGKVDIIVNNAGVSGPVKTFTNASFQDFKDCVAIHLTGTFWTSVQGLKVMERGSKIITIATFFTEENKYEQRPYRFRTPYTAAQGASYATTLRSYDRAMISSALCILCDHATIIRSSDDIVGLVHLMRPRYDHTIER